LRKYRKKWPHNYGISLEFLVGKKETSSTQKTKVEKMEEKKERNWFAKL